jgi:hypothetical protein
VDGGPDVDRFLAELSRWAADERAGEAAERRRRERWLRQQTLEDATLTGVAVDLAERSLPVAVRLTTGRTVTGRITTVATDFWVLAGATTPSLVASAAVATIRPGGGTVLEEATGRRDCRLTMRFGDALAGLAGERPTVQLGSLGSDVVRGELRAVGDDVVSVRVESSPPTSVYLALPSITDCTVLQL